MTIRCLVSLVLICLAAAIYGCATGDGSTAKTSDDKVASRPAASMRPAAENDWSKDEFQFLFTFNNPYSTGGSKQSDKSQVYVYVPAKAKNVRALFLLQQNVIEQMISVHPAIRRVCDENNIAIAWCLPGFDMVFQDNAQEMHELVQQQFGAFGQTIGYPELGNVPLITFGHSNTTSYAQHSAEARPDRVLAAIITHGGGGGSGVSNLTNYSGPLMYFRGQHSEWRQQGKELLANKPLLSLDEVSQRMEKGWVPLGIIDEYSSGHFDYSEPIVNYFAMFIDKAVKARLGEHGELKALDPNTGYIANVPALPTGAIEVKAYKDAAPAERAHWPWYLDRELAETAAKIIAGDGPWSRKPQFIGYNNPDGTAAEFTRGGLVSPVPYQITPGSNIIKFFPVMLDKMPPGFLEEGQSLSIASDPTITMEYDCGAYTYRDSSGHYRVKINRSYPTGYGFIVASNRGDENTRPTHQPTRLPLWSRDAVPAVPMVEPGDQQSGATIVLDAGPIGDQYKGYFVDHGPARVVNGKLKILPMPANTKGPVEVKLVAYTLGQKVTGSSSVTFNVTR